MGIAAAGPASGVPPDLRPARRALAIGNSITGQNVVTSDATSAYWTGGFIHWANWMMGAPLTFDRVGNGNTYGSATLTQGVYAWGGQISDTIVPQIPALLAVYRPDVVLFNLFENDIVSGNGVAASYANLKIACQLCLAVGATPIVFSILPSLSYTTGTHNDYWWKMNDLIFDYAARTKGVIAVDISSVYLDDSLTLPQPKANRTDATVHPNNRGIMMIAKRIRDQLQYTFRPNYWRPWGKSDINALSAVIANPAMNGTAGTAGTGTTGNVATGWSVSAPGTGNSAVASKVADATNYGGKNSQKVAGTYSGAGVASTDPWQTFTSGASTGYSVGDGVFGVLECEVTGTPANFKGIELQISFTTSGGALVSQTFGSGNTGWNGETYPDGRLTILTPIFNIPTGTTALRPFIRHFLEVGATSGNADLTIHACNIYKETLLAA